LASSFLILAVEQSALSLVGCMEAVWRC
jgi:hypothetical protein